MQKKNEPQTAADKLPAVTEAVSHDIETEQHYPGSSELFKGLPPSDLAASQAEVKRHVLPHWPNIAERSRYVRGRLVPVLEAMNAPADLQAIPVIESGYNPYALSHAGAMGLWQLMPRTAKGLGVSNSGGLNGRRSVEISTQAAVTYLISMRERFGNWPLAFAAYHLGPTAVARRLKRSPWVPEDGLNNMPVPSVTRAYVRHVIGFAAMLQMKTVEFPEPFPTISLQLFPPVDLKMLASVSSLDRKTLFLFNPGLDHSQYLKDEVTLHIPREHETAVLEKLEEVGPKYVNATIQSGDSLWTLARRHHTSVNHLRSLNPELGDLLSIGGQIKVPANQLARANPLPNPLLSQGRRIRYKVRSGDSLWIIARRFGTTTRDIARSNQISQSSLIRPGDTLWILASIRPS
ncbi:MAG: LysM peptidoglycan-binding domain-containing protein [Mariprofundaceae bacterium]|nr:LysM peptidoglycan-binding domain-containing protein [Mariprofundaceae bacterium]